MTGFGFWTPLFLAGIGLLVLPWFIHRIRRPERDTIRFSSLQFLPEFKQEVIERRKVQHPLLMLLRMLLLLLLALAFARPYLRLDPEVMEAVNQTHLILLDISLSVSGTFDQAKERVRDILNELPESHRVGLIVFSDSPRIISSLKNDPNQTVSTKQSVLSGLDRVTPGWGATDYVAGMAFAERHLLESVRGDTTVGLTLHLISDFQETGLGEHNDGWRLSARIAFVPHEVDPPVHNLAVTDAVLSRKDEGHRLKIRVQNPSTDDVSTRVRVFIDNRIIRSEEVTLPSGNARQVSFDFVLPTDRITTGYVELDKDELPADNTRYFAWTPPRRPVVVIASGTKSSRLTAALIKAALPASRWDVREGASARGENADLWIADRIEDLDIQAIGEYVSGGGALLLMLDPRSSRSPWNRAFADVTGIRLDANQMTGPTSLSEVDFDHPVFAPLRSPKFNDFSNLRYDNIVSATWEKDSSARAIATFENGQPAMVEGSMGKGKVMLWTGGVAPTNTNLTRRPRFVPLLQETITYLIDREAPPTNYLIGHRLSGDQPHPIARHTSKSGQSREVGSSNALWEIGWLSTFEEGRIIRTASVNFDPAETDGARIPVSEFQLRLCHAEPVMLQASGRTAIPGEQAPRAEHGFALVLILALALILENVYAAKLETV